MNDTTENPVPGWFKTLAIIALIWNLLGVMSFFIQMNMSEEALALLPQAEQELYRNIPVWVTAAYGLAVFAGTLGCLMMMGRKSVAVSLLIASLVGVLVQMGHMFFLTDAVAVLGMGRMIMPLIVILIAVALVMMARKGVANGWLK